MRTGPERSSQFSDSLQTDSCNPQIASLCGVLGTPTIGWQHTKSDVHGLDATQCSMHSTNSDIDNASTSAGEKPFAVKAS